VDLERRLAGHTGPIVLAAALIAFAGSAVHLQRFEEVRGGTGSPEAAGIAGDGLATSPTAVGPRIGDDIEAYLAARAAVLAAVGDTEVLRAVVSFDGYRSAGDVRLPDEVVVEAVQVRVPIVDVPPQQEPVTDADLTAAVAVAVAELHAVLEEEVRDLRTTLASDVGDDAFQRDFERRLEELADLDDVLVADAPVVFAVVVSATGADLRALGAADGIRFVDPGGAPERTTGVRFYGVLPDDTVRATHGRPV
jgi:hypothetical protein